jgi:murein DD-endopeptidase MepM/ murein hydrolase activator NlpD
LLAATAVLAPSGPADAQTLDELRQEVAEAKAAANDAAARYTDAQSRFEELGDEIEAAEQSIASLEAQAVELQEMAEHRAVSAYIGRDAEFPVELDDEDVLDSARRTELLERVNARDNDAVDALDALTEDLEVKRDELAAAQEEQARLAEQFKAEQEELEAKVAEAEAAVAALAEQLRIQQYLTELQAEAEANAVLAAGSVPSPNAPVINGLVCPVPGAAFSNDWGQPRSGGRTHQGNDLFAPTGTPNVAVIGGTVTYANEDLGGLVAYLAGSNGNVYYYGHLSQFVGGARSVSQGEVIGLTGQTGNASGPHTHFEIRIGGATRINPYPTLAAIC